MIDDSFLDDAAVRAGQRSNVSRAPRPLQGSHVDSSQVAKVVAISFSIAELAVVVVVVQARRVIGGWLLLKSDTEDVRS